MTAVAEQPAKVLRYTNVAIVLHWAIAAMIFGLIGSGFAMMNLMGQGSELQYNVYQVHKSFGVMVLILTVARVLWRVFNRPPEEPDSVTPLERKASHFVHMAFYSMMILIPLSGWVLITVSPIQVETVLFFQSWLPWPHVPGLTTLSESTQDLLYFLSHYAHAILAYGALILAGLHIAGALKHQLADGDFIQRMLPARGDGGQTVGFGHATAWSAALVFAVAMIGAGAVARMDPNVVADASGPTAPAVIVAAVDPAAEPPAVTQAETPAPTDAAWVRDPAVGGLTFTMEFDGETIEGAFASFETDIVFDPDNLAGSSVIVTIDTGSATLSSRSVTQSQLTGSDGFAVTDFPVATFASDAIRADGDGYLADGTLTIRGEAVPQTLAFTVEIDGDRAVAEGSLPVDRFDFGIGTRGDDVGTTLAPEVLINFAIEADRASDPSDHVVQAAPPAGKAPAWVRDEAASDLSFVMGFDGAEIRGTFGSFETEIFFDPNNLAGSSVDVAIDTGSATLSSRDVSQGQLTGSDGFAVSDFPQARFVSESIEADGAGYLAVGTLTIRDQAVPQTLAFTVDIDGDRAVASGRLVVDRFDYGIGTRSDDVGTTLAPEIVVEFNLEADRVGPGASEAAAVSTDADAAATVPGAPAPLWTVQRDESSLAFRFDFDGDEMVAAFERFDAAIRFDPDNLPGSSLNVSIDLGSAALATRGVSDFQLKGSDGFNVSRYPTATFIADTIKAVPEGYEAVGSLSLRGVDAPVVLPFTLDIEDNVGRARASVVLDRAAFGIAEGADNVGGSVTVDITITAAVASSVEMVVK